MKLSIVHDDGSDAMNPSSESLEYFYEEFGIDGCIM